MKKTLVILGVFLLFFTLYLFASNPDEGESLSAPAFKTTEVQEGELTLKISAKGVVEPNFTVEVKSKASGEVLKFDYEEGDFIKKGELLLQLDKSDELRNVARAKADESSSIAKLKRAETALLLQKTKYQTDMKKAESGVQAAAANLQESGEKLKRQTDLFEKQFASQEALDAAETTTKVNREKLVQAQAQLQAARDSVHDITMKENEIELAETEVERSRIALEEAQERLQETEIYAPITGVIIQKLVEEGQIIASGISNVSGGTALATLADMSRLFIVADVDETDIGSVQLGQKVVITADAFVGRIFAGKVTRIAPQGQVESSITIFKVKIEILGSGLNRLKSMMTANLDIIIRQIPSTLYVAREAVRSKNGRRFAMVLEDGVPVETEIYTGILTPIHAEIESGLRHGQKVIVGDWEKALAEAGKSGNKGSALRKILWMIRSK